jgi:hypothetical protein
MQYNLRREISINHYLIYSLNIIANKLSKYRTFIDNCIQAHYINYLVFNYSSYCKT